MDAKSFRAFYDEAFPVVFGYLANRVGGAHSVAADLTQETFISAVRSLRRGAEVEAPMPWIVSIARRRLIDHIRAETVRRRPIPATDPSIEIGPGWTADFEGRLIAALSAVQPGHRLVLILRYVDDLTVEQVAAEIGRSIRAIESLLARACVALRGAWKETDRA